jgi:hypothetical protein
MIPPEMLKQTRSPWITKMNRDKVKFGIANRYSSEPEVWKRKDSIMVKKQRWGKKEQSRPVHKKGNQNHRITQAQATLEEVT